MKSPKNQRFERIYEEQSCIEMMPLSIETEEDNTMDNLGHPSSPPAEAPESLVSSPQGTAPKPVASFSPIATPSIQNVPVVSQSVTNILSQFQEEQNTPKAIKEKSGGYIL